MTRKILAVLMALGMLAPEAAFAQPAPSGKSKQVEITWDELAGFVVEKKISTVLPDGVRLQGEVLAVRPESLVLDVQKSSRKKLYPLGQTEVPRSSVSLVLVIRERSAAMRIVGGILGGIGGLFATSGIAVATDSVAVVLPGLLCIIPGSAVAGYYAGKLADRYITRIAIRPAVPATSPEEN